MSIMGNKTNKHQTLVLAQKQGSIRANDLVQAFTYSPATARSYLSYLGRHDLLVRGNSGYMLSEKGKERLEFFKTNGCGNYPCPVCQANSRSFICPLCGYELDREMARCLPERDFWIVLRPAGVLCPRCLSLVLTATQAKLVGVTEES
jgi:hypothetical protein